MSTGRMSGAAAAAAAPKSMYKTRILPVRVNDGSTAITYWNVLVRRAKPVRGCDVTGGEIMADGCIRKCVVTKIMEEKNVRVFVRLTRPQNIFFAADFVENPIPTIIIRFLSIL